MPGFLVSTFRISPANVGDTEDEVLASARQALAFHVDGMREDGETIPAAASLEEIRHHPGVDDGHVITAALR